MKILIGIFAFIIYLVIIANALVQGGLISVIVISSAIALIGLTILIVACALAKKFKNYLIFLEKKYRLKKDLICEELKPLVSKDLKLIYFYELYFLALESDGDENDDYKTVSFKSLKKSFIKKLSDKSYFFKFYDIALSRLLNKNNKNVFIAFQNYFHGIYSREKQIEEIRDALRISTNYRDRYQNSKDWNLFSKYEKEVNELSKSLTINELNLKIQRKYKLLDYYFKKLINKGILTDSKDDKKIFYIALQQEINAQRFNLIDTLYDKYKLDKSMSDEKIISSLYRQGKNIDVINEFLQIKNEWNYFGLSKKKYIKDIELVVGNETGNNIYFKQDFPLWLREKYINKYHISIEDDDKKVQEKIKKYFKKNIKIYAEQFDSFLKNKKLCTILKNYIASELDSYILEQIMPYFMIEADKVNNSKYKIFNFDEKYNIINHLIEENIYYKLLNEALDTIQKSTYSPSCDIFNCVQYMTDKNNDINNENHPMYVKLEEVFDDYGSVYNVYNKIVDIWKDIIYDEDMSEILNINTMKESSLKFFYAVIYYFAKDLNRNKTKMYKDKYNFESFDNSENIAKKLYINGLSDDSICEILLYNDADYDELVSSRKFYDLTDYDDIIKEAKEIVDRQQRLKNLSLNSVDKKIKITDIDLMAGYEFEKFISRLFQKMGYKAYTTQESNDQGIDVIAEKGDVKVAIQTKCYSGTVGNYAIMEAVAGSKYYDANKVMVITNSTFTKSAIELAKKNNVQLWDRKTLIEKIDEI